jgi:hypothetical protein
MFSHHVTFIILYTYPNPFFLFLLVSFYYLFYLYLVLIMMLSCHLSIPKIGATFKTPHLQLFCQMWHKMCHINRECFGSCVSHSCMQPLCTLCFLTFTVFSHTHSDTPYYFLWKCLCLGLLGIILHFPKVWPWIIHLHLICPRCKPRHTFFLGMWASLSRINPHIKRGEQVRQQR